jgi:hypothetical protein
MFFTSTQRCTCPRPARAGAVIPVSRRSVTCVRSATTFVAGEKFAKVLAATNRPPDPLFIPKLALCWLLKSHLNYIRVASAMSRTEIPRDPEIYQSILGNQIPNPSRFRLFTLGYDSPKGLRLLWTVSQGTRVCPELGIVVSGLRIRWFETILVLPFDPTHPEAQARIAAYQDVKNLHPAIEEVRVPAEYRNLAGVCLGTAKCATDINLFVGIKQYGPAFLATRLLFPPQKEVDMWDFCRRHNGFPDLGPDPSTT